jgi:hypothetical protein
MNNFEQILKENILSTLKVNFTFNQEILYTEYCNYIADMWKTSEDIDTLYDIGLVEIDTIDEMGIVYRVLTMDECVELGIFKENNYHTFIK